MIKKISNKIKYLIGLCVFIMAVFTLVNDFIKESHAYINNSDNVIIHFLDVGEADATLIELPNDKLLLIDSGEYVNRFQVSNYIKELGYTKIDYVVATHPHSDHIGGMAYIINNFDIGKVYMPKVVSNTVSYEYLLKSVDNKKLKAKVAKNGVNILNDDYLHIYFIAPNKHTYEDLNNYSAVVKIDYYNKSFLFMADALKESEDEITADVEADVVKVAHHGSYSSSSVKFVNRVKAKYAIISVGADNQYNLPAKDIVRRWELSGAKVYRTDLNGTIKVISDGKSIKIEKER